MNAAADSVAAAARIQVCSCSHPFASVVTAASVQHRHAAMVARQVAVGWAAIPAVLKAASFAVAGQSAARSAPVPAA